MSSTLSGFHYEENKIGGTFKSSTIEYIWEFIIDGTIPNKIQLIDSKWTGKKRLFKNGVEVFDKKNDGSFLKNFEIDDHIFSIIYYGDKCELRIDNQSFSHLSNLEKNKNYFNGEEARTSKTQVIEGFNASEKNGTNLFKLKDKEENSNIYKNSDKKPGLFNFKIKVDESKNNSGLKNFKFGPGIKFSNNKNTTNKNINNIGNVNNNNNNDLLGFGDIINNDNSTNTNNNINDIFGLGMNNNNDNIHNKGNNNINVNNNNINNDIFSFIPGSNNNIKVDDSNKIAEQKSTNDQLADIFSIFAQSSNTNSNKNKETSPINNNKVPNEVIDKDKNNNTLNNQNGNPQNDNKENNILNIFSESNNINKESNEMNNNASKENIIKDKDIVNDNKVDNQENNLQNLFNFKDNLFNNEKDETKNKNNNEPDKENENIEEKDTNKNNIDADEINKHNNNMELGYDFVSKENNNINKIEENKTIPVTGFDYEAYNNAKKVEPKTNNDKLDNSLKNLF